MKTNIAAVLLARALSILCISTLFLLSIAARVVAAPLVQPDPTPDWMIWSTGTINTPVIWTAADSPYLVTTDVTITAAGSLTIEPGVIVKMSSGKGLTVDGTLIAQGTSGSPVVFTSYRDDSFGGDTNNDGASAGAKGDWHGITIRSGLTGSLANLRIRYGWKGLHLSADNAGETISPSLSNLVIEETYTYGVHAAAISPGSVVSPALQNVRVLSCGSIGFFADASGTSSTASPSLNGVELGNTGSNGISLVASGSSTATAGLHNVEIHHSSYGPISLDGNGWAIDLGGNNLHDNAISAVRISGPLAQSRTWVSFAGLPYYLVGNVVIGSGVTLTLPAGLIVKGTSGTGLTVDGALVLQSTAADPIVFTSYRDDSYGGDSNGGGPSVGARGDWAGVVIRSSITNLANLRIRYASTGLSLTADGAAENISPSVLNLIIEESSATGLSATASGANSIVAPAISNTQILSAINYGVNATATGSGASVALALNGVVLGNAATGIYVSATGSSSTVTMQNSEIHHANFPIYLVGNGWVTDLGGNSLHNNTISAVGISGTLSQSRTWAPIQGLAYYLDSNFTVATGATLTLPEGLIVKADTNSHLYIDGALVGEGTTDHPVVFTSYKDDSIGGDTNGNGASVGAKADWSGIVINSAATTALSNLRIRYALLGLELYANNAGENISPSLSNLLIEESYGHGFEAYAYAANTVVSPALSNVQILSSGSCGLFATTLGSGASASPALDRVVLGSNETGLCISATGNNSATAALHNVEIHHSESPLILDGNGWLSDLGGVNLHDNDVSALQITGTLDQNRTLTPFFGLPYQIYGELRVSGGVTLTIPAGSVIKARGTLTIGGTLVSQGTAAEPVIFTSYRDDTYGGDSNNDGPSVGMAGDWNGISIESSTTASLANLRIRYAVVGLNLYAAYLSQNISPSLTNLVIEDSKTYGLEIYAGGSGSVVSPAVSNIQILRTGKYGMFVNASVGATAAPTLNGAELGSNDTGMYLATTNTSGSSAVAALQNVDIHHSRIPLYIWGNGWVTDQGGVTLHDNTISAIGMGGTLSQNRTWAPFHGLTYYLDNNFIVAAGTTLTLPADTIVKAASGAQLSVDGVLVSQGDADHPVIFTAASDDSYGGDMTGNGPSVGMRGGWTGLSITSSATTSLANLRIRYATTGLDLTADSAGETISPSLTNLVIEESSTYGLYAYASGSGSSAAPLLDGVVLGNNGIGVYASGSSGSAVPSLKNAEIHHSTFPVYINGNGWVVDQGGNIFHDNSTQAMGIAGTLSQNRTWMPFSGLPLFLDNNVTVTAGITLTLPGGLLVKADAGSQLVMEGTLFSQGSGSNPVVFTSYRDDGYGGDTNNNGASTGVRGDWAGISIRSAATTQLAGMRIRYATTGLDLTADGAAETISPTLTDIVIEESSSYGLRAYASAENSVAAPVLDGVVLGNNSTGVYVLGSSGGSAIPALKNAEIHRASFPIYCSGNGWVVDQGGNSLHDNTIKAVGLGGTLAQNRTWAPFGGLPFYLDNDVTVAAGVTLTLPAGLLVKADTGSQLIVDGTLVSQGTKAAPVVFTSYQDDSHGGDTTSNGATTGTMYDWDGILLRGTGTTTFANAVIHYAREGLYIYAQGTTLTPTIRNVDIKYSYNGIYLYAASGAVSPTISDSLLTANSRGVYISTGTGGVANPQIQHSDIYANTSYGIISGYSGGTINAENNWWGDPSGPFHSSLNPTGKGNAASSNVDFNPWLQEKVFLDGKVTLYPTMGVAPLSVHFNGQVSGGQKPILYTWEFGDGETSSEALPVHTYTNEGVYPVKLTAVSADELRLVRFASVVVHSPVTGTITATPTSGKNPLAVTFHATAGSGVPPYTYHWDFNQDGEDDSTEQNPSHTFYSSTLVRLTVEDSLGYSTMATEEITVGQPYSVVILADPPGGYSPLTVSFGAQIAGGSAPFTYAWDFDGDGSVDSKLAAPSHEFPREGSYQVALKVSDSLGVDAFANLPVQITLPPATLSFTQLDATRFPIIESWVRVIGSDGKLLNVLSEANFQVTEQIENEGAAVDEIIDVVGQPDPGGISVALVMDISGSMDGSAMAQVRNAGNRFVDQMNFLDKAAIIPFGTSAWVQQPFTSDPFALHAAISALNASGATALYDGVYLGIDQCNKQTGVRAVVIFTDGVDNASSRTVEQAIAHANETGIPVFTIGVGGDANTALLERLAQQTGGTYTLVPSAADLAQIYNDITALLQNQYLITYRTHNPALDQTERTVSISVTNNQYASSAARTYQVMGTPQTGLTPETAALLPASQAPGEEIPISVRVSGENIITVTLYYRRTADGGRYQTMGMVETGSGVYNATLPADFVQAPGVDFYIEASNGTVTSADPAVDAVTHPHQIPVTPNSVPALLHTPVTHAVLGADQLIQAVATDSSGSPTDVTLYYRRTGKVVYTKEEMVLSGKDVYQGLIPPEALGEEGIEYYITATDKDGLTTYNGTAQVPHRVSIHDGYRIFLPMVGR